MKKFPLCVGVLIAGLSAANAFGQYYPAPLPCPPVRTAPDMYAPSYYYTDGYSWYPYYCVYPSFQPVGGIVPTPQASGGGGQQQANTAFPINPWTRSPRDFFMWNEAQKERITRETRPPFVR